VIFSYIPSHTILHKLQINAKLGVLVVYVCLIFVSTEIMPIFALILIFVAATLILGLWIRGQFLVFITGLLLILAMLPSFFSPLISNLIIGLSKLVSISLVIGLFTMTTKVSQVLQLLHNHGRNTSFLRQVAYIVYTMVSALPVIKYDLQRAIDAEILRQSHQTRLIWLSSWINIVIIVLNRALARSERFADSVLDRGFNLGRGFSSSDAQSLTWNDWVAACIFVVPGLSVMAIF